jgi:hypothetical protein
MFADCLTLQSTDARFFRVRVALFVERSRYTAEKVQYSIAYMNIKILAQNRFRDI